MKVVIAESYTVSARIGEPDHYVVVEEWRDEAALDAHFASAAFSRFQWSLHRLLARPSQVRIHDVNATRRPVASAPMDPRIAS
jgi:quinol monooxygenase YgiN